MPDWWCRNGCAGTALQTVTDLRLPATFDPRGVERTVHFYRCPQCAAGFVGEYRETWEPWGEDASYASCREHLHDCDAAEFPALLAEASACPDRTNPSCSCPAHRRWADGSPSGRVLKIWHYEDH
ncbi:MAG: hypothetical protein HYY17_04315 [Planctomycetes bacterium]|nr:hypothetical protein [Planctomycetota bacterium]